MNAEPSTPNGKSARPSNTPASIAAKPIPGCPPDVPAAVRELLAKQLQEQLDERSARRGRATVDAEKWLERAKATNDDKLKPAMLVMAGMCLVDGLKSGEAVQTFERVTVEFPKSEWAVEARLFLFDLALEHELSVTRATEWLQPAVQWSNSVPRPSSFQKPNVLAIAVSVGNTDGPLPLQSLGPKLATQPSAQQEKSESDSTVNKPESPSAAADQNKPDRDTSPSGTETSPPIPALRDIPRIVADVRTRAGLLFAMQASPRARAAFAQAQLYGIDESSAVGTYANRVLTQQADPPLPDPVKNGVAETVQLIRLAIILEESLERYRAVRLWDALLKQPPGKITDPQRSYVHFRRARIRTFLTNPLDREPDRIFADYEAAVTLYPKSEWTELALNSHAETLWGLNFDADRSVAIWKRLLDEYPDSPHNDGAALSIGRVYHATRKWELAKTTLEDAQQRFPKSTLSGEYDRLLRSVRSELSRPKSK